MRLCLTKGRPEFYSSSSTLASVKKKRSPKQKLSVEQSVMTLVVTDSDEQILSLDVYIKYFIYLIYPADFKTRYNIILFGYISL
jgi:hypothetical protein